MAILVIQTPTQGALLVRSAAPPPASAWLPPARTRRTPIWQRSPRIRVRADVLLVVVLVAASLLGTAWAATSPGSAQVGVALGTLAFVVLCATLALAGWSARQAWVLGGSSASGHFEDGTRQVQAYGWWFAGWFAAHQLVWSVLGLALAAGVLLPRGATADPVLATVGGLLTVAACGVMAALSAAQPLLTGQAAALAACWRSPIPHGVDNRKLWARAVGLLLLPTRLAQVRLWDSGQPQPFLRKIVQVSEDARRARAGYLLDVRPAPGVTWRAEFRQRAAVYLTIWLLGALVALIALRAGLIAPMVPALTALTGVDPLTAPPSVQATPTPDVDAGGGGGGGGGGGNQGTGGASGAGSPGQGNGEGVGQGSSSGQGSAGQGHGDGGSVEGSGGSGESGGSAGQSQGAGQRSGQSGQQGEQTGQQGQGQSGQGSQGSGQQGRGAGQQNQGGGPEQQGSGASGGQQQAGVQHGQQGQGDQSQEQVSGGREQGESQGSGGGGDQQGQRSESEDSRQGDGRGGSDRPGGGTGGPGSAPGGDPSAPPTPPQLGAPTPVQPPAAQSTDDVVSIELPAIGPGQPAQGTPQALPITPIPAQPGQAGPQGPDVGGTTAGGSRSAGQPLPPWIQSLLDGANGP
jgi:hypothetical protein